MAAMSEAVILGVDTIAGVDTFTTVGISLVGCFLVALTNGGVVLRVGPSLGVVAGGDLVEMTITGVSFGVRASIGDNAHVSVIIGCGWFCMLPLVAFLISLCKWYPKGLILVT